MPTPGVARPLNLVDVLNALSGQVTSNTDNITNSSGGSVPGIGVVVETDEPGAPIADTAIGAALLPPTWDNGGWNAAVWS